MEADGVRRLLAEAGVDARRFRTALELLCDGGWWTLADLVRATATSRRGVEALLRVVSPQRSGDRFRLTPDQVRACRLVLEETSGLVLKEISGDAGPTGVDAGRSPAANAAPRRTASAYVGVRYEPAGG